MRLLREDLLVQFSAFSFIIMVAIAVALSMILTSKLNNNIELLKQHGATMMAGNMIEPTDPYSIPSLTKDVSSLRLITIGAVGGGFIILYAGLVYIVWRGRKTIGQQQAAIYKSHAALQMTNEQLLSAQDKLVRAEKLAAIGELSAGVAHELRNPLGAINNSVFYIKGKLSGSDLVKENPRIGQFLEIMEEEIISSNQIITDLMDYARVKPPTFSPTPLDALVDNALARVEMKADVEVLKEFESDEIGVLVDSEQIRRVVMNIIKNADEAMPEGGKLTINARVAGDYAELRISDTGGGIDADDLPKLFEPLFTTKAKGIGLGLAIVSEIVRKHNGSINATSNPGEGTTFTLRLPLSSRLEIESPVA